MPSQIPHGYDHEGKAGFEIIAPKVGVTASGGRVQAHHMIDSGPSVLFDAVVLLTSHQAIDDLVKKATAPDFVADACQRCKSIGYDQSALPVLDKARISTALDEDTVALSSAKDLSEFVRQGFAADRIMKFRRRVMRAR